MPHLTLYNMVELQCAATDARRLAGYFLTHRIAFHYAPEIDDLRIFVEERLDLAPIRLALSGIHFTVVPDPYKEARKCTTP